MSVQPRQWGSRKVEPPEAGFPNGQALDLLTEAEVASALRVTDRTVRRWDAEGIVQAIRIGGVKRYRSRDIAALIDPPTRTGHAGNVTGSKLAVTGDGHDEL